MRDINLFLKEISQIQWFQSAGKENEKYMVLCSIFEAVDDWNQQMFQVWEVEINELEKKILSFVDKSKCFRRKCCFAYQS